MPSEPTPGALAADDRARRLRLALGLNVGIVGAQAAFGVIAGSLGLLADAGHNLTDVAALATSLLAVRWARRAPTARRSFGYHRATVFAALANAGSIIAVTALIVFEGVRRLADPSDVDGGIVLGVALVAGVVNVVAALALREDHHGHAHGRDLNMQSALLHMVGDAAASFGVAIAGAVILVTGGNDWLDPLCSILISVVIAVQALRLTWHALHVLFESTPADIDTDELAAHIAAQPGIAAVHDLHVWSLSSDVRALSAHVVVDGATLLADAQRIADSLKQVLRDRYAIAHTTLEVEAVPCGDDDEPPCAFHDVAPTTVGHDHSH